MTKLFTSGFSSEPTIGEHGPGFRMSFVQMNGGESWQVPFGRTPIDPHAAFAVSWLLNAVVSLRRSGRSWVSDSAWTVPPLYWRSKSELMT